MLRQEGSVTQDSFSSKEPLKVLSLGDWEAAKQFKQGKGRVILACSLTWQNLRY